MSLILGMLFFFAHALLLCFPIFRTNDIHHTLDGAALFLEIVAVLHASLQLLSSYNTSKPHPHSDCLISGHQKKTKKHQQTTSKLNGYFSRNQSESPSNCQNPPSTGWGGAATLSPVFFFFINHCQDIVVIHLKAKLFSFDDLNWKTKKKTVSFVVVYHPPGPYS